MHPTIDGQRAVPKNETALVVTPVIYRRRFPQAQHLSRGTRDASPGRLTKLSSCSHSLVITESPMDIYRATASAFAGPEGGKRVRGLAKEPPGRRRPIDPRLMCSLCRPLLLPSATALRSLLSLPFPLSVSFLPSPSLPLSFAFRSIPSLFFV